LVIVLSPIDHAVLTARARAGRSEHRDVVRARIVLAAAAGSNNEVIAAEVGVHLDTVRKWRRRFATAGLAGLVDLPRSGRPRRFTRFRSPTSRRWRAPCRVRAGVPLSRWSGAELAAEVVTRGLAEAISASTVRRWLSADAIKPWQHRSWIFPRDPQFEVKAARALDLYARQWQGRPLGQDEYVISADEKSQLQALRRRHDGEPPGPGRTRRVEFEYTRGGTLAYFAAYDVHRAQVIGATAPTTGIEPFTDLVTPGDDHPAVRLGPAGVLGRGQRLLPQRGPLHRTDADGVADRDPGPPTRARVLAEPGGDLLLNPAA